MHTTFLTPLIIYFLKFFQTSDFPSAVEVATSAAEAESELKDGSVEVIKFMEGVSGYMNGSIGV